MHEFLEFYSNGSVFNHLVTLFCLAALTATGMHAFGPRRAGDPQLLRLAERFAAIGVAAGALGVLFNLVEMGAALATVPAELAEQASSRAMTIVPIPLIWALMCAIPVWVVTACLRHRALDPV